MGKKEERNLIRKRNPNPQIPIQPLGTDTQDTPFRDLHLPSLDVSGAAVVQEQFDSIRAPSLLPLPTYLPNYRCTKHVTTYYLLTTIYVACTSQVDNRTPFAMCRYSRYLPTGILAGFCFLLHVVGISNVLAWAAWLLGWTPQVPSFHWRPGVAATTPYTKKQPTSTQRAAFEEDGWMGGW